MGAFGWYVVILTIAYIFYYGFMLAWDQYGVKGQNKDFAEDFEGIDGGTGNTRVVSESAGGGYVIEDEGAHDILSEEEEESAAGGTVVIGEEHHDEPEPGGGSPEDYQPESQYDGGGGDPADTGDDADDGLGNEDDGGFARLRSLQEALPKVLKEYEEEYDSSEMKILMQQRPEYETRIKRIQLRQ